MAYNDNNDNMDGTDSNDDYEDYYMDDGLDGEFYDDEDGVGGEGQFMPHPIVLEHHLRSMDIIGKSVDLNDAWLWAAPTGEQVITQYFHAEGNEAAQKTVLYEVPENGVMSWQERVVIRGHRAHGDVIYLYGFFPNSVV